jgi:hypothetical protein
MKLENRSSYQANFLWGDSGPDELGVAVIAKATYDLTPSGLVQTQEDPWPVHFDNLETPYGVFYSEYTPYMRPRVDFIVCGFARSPRQRPVRQMTLSFQVGDVFAKTLRVTGRRVWEQRGRELAPSTLPEELTELPLTLDYAFGGETTIEWGTLAYPANPKGRGYFFDKEMALGLELPRIEDPNDLVRSVDDRPRPVTPGPYPMDGALRTEGYEKEKVQILEVAHLFLNNAHPDFMIDAEIEPGTLITAEGLSHNGPLNATVPTFDAAVFVQQGGEKREIAMRLDTIILLGEEQRAVFRWRGGTRLPLAPRERRRVVIHPQRHSTEVH